MKSLNFLAGVSILTIGSLYAAPVTTCVDDNRTEQGTSIIIDGTCADPVPLPYPDRPDCGNDMKLIQGNDNNCTNGVLEPDPGPYPPLISCPPGKIVDQGTGGCTLDAPSTTEPLPENITISFNKLQETIVSTYDDTPYDPAIDIPGMIDGNGTEVSMSATASTVLNLPARQYSVTIDSSMTQNNESGIILTLAWAAQQLTDEGATHFTAFITVDDSAGDGDGIFYAKQLDTNETDGLVVATFPYAVDSLGNEGNLTLKIETVIPDRMYGVADNSGDTEAHKFLYLPVTNPKTGKTWLNNNLGANYANMNHPEFNPGQQAKSSNDFNAYGSLSQWGRKADGHELVTWTSGSGGTLTATTYTRSDSPTHTSFIKSQQYTTYDWRLTSDDTLWSSESSTNNVCPVGYRLPTSTELSQEANSWVPKNATGALNGALAIPLPGYRYHGSGNLYSAGSFGYYWTASTYQTYAYHIYLYSGGVSTAQHTPRAEAAAVRCIKD